jgi:hypothetical protein
MDADLPDFSLRDREVALTEHNARLRQGAKDLCADARAVVAGAHTVRLSAAATKERSAALRNALRSRT